MRIPPALPALLVALLAATGAQAQSNVALGKPVTLVNPAEFGTGSGYFGGGNGGFALPSPAIVTDGIFQAGYWATGIWWDEQNSGAHSFVQVDLQGLYTLTGLAVMADQNDSYLLEVRNAQGLWQLGNPASFTCSSAPVRAGTPATAVAEAAACQFNAQDDQQERARYGLLDWNVRNSLKK